MMRTRGGPPVEGAGVHPALIECGPRYAGCPCAFGREMFYHTYYLPALLPLGNLFDNPFDRLLKQSSSNLWFSPHKSQNCMMASSNEALMADFRAQIKECEIHAYCKRPFLRVEKLRKWLKAHVGSLLEATYQQWHSPELPITAEELCEKHSGLLLFSILLELGRGKYVHVFGPKEVTNNLPIAVETLEHALRATPESDIPKADKESLCKDFNRIQWRYCPPKLRLRWGADYEANHVVPILRKEPINTKGGTAKVWQIEVLEDFIEQDLALIVSESKFDRKDDDPSDNLGWVKFPMLRNTACTYSASEIQFCAESFRRRA